MAQADSVSEGSWLAMSSAGRQQPPPHSGGHGFTRAASPKAPNEWRRSPGVVASATDQRLGFTASVHGRWFALPNLPSLPIHEVPSEWFFPQRSLPLSA